MQETFRVPDISCDHCKKAIEGALRPIEGVERADVDVPSRTVTVEWRPGGPDRASVAAAIEGAGYGVAG